VLRIIGGTKKSRGGERKLALQGSSIDLDSRTGRGSSYQNGQSAIGGRGARSRCCAEPTKDDQRCRSRERRKGRGAKETAVAVPTPGGRAASRKSIEEA